MKSTNYIELIGYHFTYVKHVHQNKVYHPQSFQTIRLRFALEKKHMICVSCYHSLELGGIYEHAVASISNFAYCYGLTFLKQCRYCCLSLGIFLFGDAKLHSG